MRRYNCGGSTVGSNGDEDRHLIKNKLIIIGEFIPLLSSFWTALLSSMRTQPTTTISQALKQWHSPNTHTLELSSSPPSCSPQLRALLIFIFLMLSHTGFRFQKQHQVEGHRGSRQQDRHPQRAQIITVVLVPPPTPSKRGPLRETASQITPMRPWSENGVCLQLLMRCQAICFCFYCTF